MMTIQKIYSESVCLRLQRFSIDERPLLLAFLLLKNEATAFFEEMIANESYIT